MKKIIIFLLCLVSISYADTIGRSFKLRTDLKNEFLVSGTRPMTADINLGGFGLDNSKYGLGRLLYTNSDGDIVSDANFWWDDVNEVLYVGGIDINDIYLRQDGTIPLTGNWAVGGYNITGIDSFDVNFIDVNVIAVPFSAGSVLFSDGTNIAEDNTNLFWNDANNRLGIGVADPDTKLEVLYDGVQLKLSRNATDNCTFEVDDDGNLTITPSYGSTIFPGSIAVGESIRDDTYRRNSGVFEPISGIGPSLDIASGIANSSVSKSVDWENQILYTPGNFISLDWSDSDNIKIGDGGVPFDNDITLTFIGGGTDGTIRWDVDEDKFYIQEDLIFGVGSITSVSGAIDFGNEALSTEETVTAGGFTTAGTITDGTASLVGGALTGLTNLTVDNVNINAAAITSDTGILGVGKLLITPGAAQPNLFQIVGDTDTGMHRPFANALDFYVGDILGLRVASSGCQSNTPFYTANKSNNAVPSIYYGSKYRAGALVTDTGILSLIGRGYDGVGYQESASIDMLADGLFTATSWPTRIEFKTTSSGSTTLTTRMAISDEVYIGDGTNKTVFSSAGVMTFHGDARFWQGVVIDTSRFKEPTANKATLVNRGIGTAYAFADGQDAEHVHVQISIPGFWDTTEDLQVILFWDSPTVSADCDWEVRYQFVANGEAMDSITFDGTVSDIVTSSGTSKGLVHSTIVIPTADFDTGDKMLRLAIYRDGDDAADTLGAIAYLHGMRVRGVRYKTGEAM